jgi:hypothetical protein
VTGRPESTGGEDVKTRLIALSAVSAVAFLFAYGIRADVIPTPWFVFFKGSVTFNGQPAPVGSIVDAYDPDLDTIHVPPGKVHCGTFTVTSAGIYGYMAVYGDDPYEPNDTTDEGADPGDTISFKVMGRNALATGDRVWSFSGDTSTVDLAATGIVAVTGVSFPHDTAAAPGDTIRFSVGVRNDGDGLDFYGVTSVSANGWTTVNKGTFTYANMSETVYVYFDVIVPVFPGDTTDTISFSVFSYLDTSKHVDSNVNLVVTLLGVDDDPFSELPNSFRLNQNYPNPFNPTTTISFSLLSRSDAALTVYNVLGQQVYRRDFGLLPAGDYDVEYDASGSQSGVYFYRLVTDVGVQTRKMVLLK